LLKFCIFVANERLRKDKMTTASKNRLAAEAVIEDVPES